MRELVRATAAWRLIHRHRPERVRVAVALSHGHRRSSTTLHKRGPESRKPRLSLAGRALGRVVRASLLRRCMKEEALRRTSRAATNSVEACNGFAPWGAFGGAGVLRQNTRQAPRTTIRYNHLVATLAGWHNVVSMTRALQALSDAGYPVTPAPLARLSPDTTEPINRFGRSAARFARVPPPITAALRRSPAPGKGEPLG